MPRLTALHQAVAQGDFEEAQRLLTEDADVNAVADWVYPFVIPSRTLNNVTPLHIAACLGYCEIAALLLQHGANPNANQQRNSRTVNSFFLMQQLFLSPLVTIGWYSSGLIASILLLVPLLVTDPTIKIPYYMMPLGLFFFGAKFLPSHFLSRLLDPLPLTFLPLTPLHLALEYGHDDMVELLLDHEANINQLGYNSHYEAVTPLLIASKKGNFNITKLLLERGASPNGMRNDHSRLSSIARWLINNDRQRSFKNLIFLLMYHTEYIGNESKFILLLEKYFFSRTPLHEAVDRGHENIVSLLLEYGADPHAICLETASIASECFTMTPLHYAFYTLSNGTGQALKYRKTEIAKLLLKKMPNLPVSLLNELLHLATESCDPGNVELLIKQGANVNSRLEKNGLTPLHRIFMSRLFPSSTNRVRSPFFHVLKFAIQSNYESKDVTAERLATLQLLIASRADVNAVASKKLLLLTPLSLAIKSYWPEAVEVLLENGATISFKEHWLLKTSLIQTIVRHYLYLESSQTDKEKKAILIRILQLPLKKTNYELIKKDMMENLELPLFLEDAKQHKETELVKFLYPFEICRNLDEENLLQARVKNAFEYLIQHGRIRVYHYDCIRQCNHALVQDYLEMFGNQLLEVIEEEPGNVPTLKVLVMDYILQNPESLSKKDLKKLTLDLKKELKEANTSMLPLTLSYPITSQRSWQELRARHHQRQQNNPYDDESLNTNDNTETEIKIKVL